MPAAPPAAGAVVPPSWTAEAAGEEGGAAAAAPGEGPTPGQRRGRCALCLQPEADAPAAALERPCGCHAAPGGVHLACLQRALAAAGPRWWAELSCADCGWWYVGRCAVPLSEAAVEAAEQRHGPRHPEVAAALRGLGRALRGAAAAADDSAPAGAAGGQPAAAVRRRQVLERALAILEEAHGREDSSLAPTLEELGQACGVLGDSERQAALVARALGLNAPRSGPSAERRSRVLGRLAEVLERHAANPSPQATAEGAHCGGHAATAAKGSGEGPCGAAEAKRQRRLCAQPEAAAEAAAAAAVGRSGRGGGAEV